MEEREKGKNEELTLRARLAAWLRSLWVDWAKLTLWARLRLVLLCTTAVLLIAKAGQTYEKGGFVGAVVAVVCSAVIVAHEGLTDPRKHKPCLFSRERKFAAFLMLVLAYNETRPRFDHLVNALRHEELVREELEMAAVAVAVTDQHSTRRLGAANRLRWLKRRLDNYDGEAEYVQSELARMCRDDFPAPMIPCGERGKALRWTHSSVAWAIVHATPAFLGSLVLMAWSYVPLWFAQGESDEAAQKCISTGAPTAWTNCETDPVTELEREARTRSAATAPAGDHETNRSKQQESLPFGQ